MSEQPNRPRSAGGGGPGALPCPPNTRNGADKAGCGLRALIGEVSPARSRLGDAARSFSFGLTFLPPSQTSPYGKPPAKKKEGENEFKSTKKEE